jgi:hypothetical protein
VGVLGVDEHAEEAVQPDVDAGGLEQLRIKRLDSQAPSIDLGPQIPIGQQHADTLVGGPDPHPATATITRSTACAPSATYLVGP